MRPVSSTQWNRRPGRGGGNKSPREPIEYVYQVSVLSSCLNQLRQQANLVNQNQNRYLETFLFPSISEIADDYHDYLSETFHLRKIKIEAFGDQTRVFYYIEDIERTIAMLETAISEFNQYSAEVIDEDNFHYKRIKLWKYFRLSSKGIKNQVEPISDFASLRLAVEFIEEIDNFDVIVAQAAMEVGIEASVDRYGIINISEIQQNSPQRLERFTDILSNYDKIQHIRLDGFVSTIEQSEQGQMIQRTEYIIQEIEDDAPVVAVVDSGVQRHELTEPFLLDTGLDYTNFDEETGQINPNGGNPFIDNADHGTSVACEIAYGRNIQDYFISQTAEELIPIAKVFPVKVFEDKRNGKVPYKEIFDFEGDFAEAVQRYDIKIINISFSSIATKDFEDINLSEAAMLMDRFAKRFNVIFVVCAGNIQLDHLEDLIGKNPELEFYSRPRRFSNPPHSESFKYINVGPPSDLLSGIVVGSCWPQDGHNHTPSSFNRSYSFLNSKTPYFKPDVLSIGGGDAPIDLSNSPPRLCKFSARIPLISSHFGFLNMSVGTSFSAPRVSRALVVGLLKYQDLSPVALKCLFLHKTSNYKISKNKRGQDFGLSSCQNDKFIFSTICDKQGGFYLDSETQFFDDTEDEVTILLEGTVTNGGIVTYDVPIASLLGDGTKRKSNKLELKLSICHMPQVASTGRKVLIKNANPFHVAGMVHLNSINPTYNYRRGRNNYTDQCIKKDAQGVILGWTTDYYVNFYSVFSQSSKLYVKDDLIQILNGHESVKVSVRGYSRSDRVESQSFAMIFSMKDMGATGTLRNRVNVQISNAL